MSGCSAEKLVFEWCSRLTRSRMAKLLASACLRAAIAFLPGLGHAQELDRDVPVHGHYSATEQGWTCNDGFKQMAGYCIPDTGDVPSQGPFEVFDGQWRCRSGYERVGRFCVIPTAPPHATLVGSGERWECDWGYRKVASRCEEITPPAHSYLEASGHDWACYPGFQRSEDQCTPTSEAPARSGGEATGTDEPKSDPPR